MSARSLIGALALVGFLVSAVYAQSVGGMSGIGPRIGGAGAAGGGGGGGGCAGVIDLSKGCTIGIPGVSG